MTINTHSHTHARTRTHAVAPGRPHRCKHHPASWPKRCPRAHFVATDSGHGLSVSSDPPGRPGTTASVTLLTCCNGDLITIAHKQALVALIVLFERELFPYKRR